MRYAIALLAVLAASPSISGQRYRSADRQACQDARGTKRYQRLECWRLNSVDIETYRAWEHPLVQSYDLLQDWERVK